MTNRQQVNNLDKLFQNKCVSTVQCTAMSSQIDMVLKSCQTERFKTEMKKITIINNAWRLCARGAVSLNTLLMPDPLEPANGKLGSVLLFSFNLQKTSTKSQLDYAIISSYWVCLFTKFRWQLHRALRLAWITWIPFILWFSMIFKIGLNIVHGVMNATFIDESLYQWSLTINVHSCIYEHTSCMINDHRNSYEHWSSMIIDIDYDSWRSMIVAMKCCWSYMISVDHCIISWTLQHWIVALIIRVKWGWYVT